MLLSGRYQNHKKEIGYSLTEHKLSVLFAYSSSQQQYRKEKKEGINMAIHESGEDYLEAILMIKKRNGNVRSIDIAHELSFSKPSVSVAMKNLKASNYITIDENGFINLTETGQEIADKIYERHTFLTGWLTSIGVDPKVAAEDACKMEHAISAESFAAIKKSIAGTHENYSNPRK